MMRIITRRGAARRRGAAQLVLVMLVIMVIGVAAAGAVRSSIAVRRADLQRQRSLTLERLLDAAEQWHRAGGEVGADGVVLQLPTDSDQPSAEVRLQPTSGDAVRITATLQKKGRTIDARSRILKAAS